ncbi:MAG: amidohydrolase family protein [Trueperaceae bacterium]
MIFDAHLHLHPGQDVTVLLRAMYDAGVDAGAICPVTTPDADEAELNATVARAVAAHPDRLVGLCSLLPYDPATPERLRAYLDQGFRGLKLHPSLQRFFPSEDRVRPTFEAAAELGVPVLVHTTVVPIPGTRSRYDDPLEIDDLAADLPDAIVIAAHGEPLGPTPAIAAKHPNVHMDTTSTFARICRLIPGAGEDALEWMGMVSGVEGSGKVLYGSDAHPDRPDRIAWNLDPLRALQVSLEAKAAITGGNAVRLLGAPTGA